MAKLSKSLKPPKLKHGEIDACLDSLDMASLLSSQVRQVKWLYNNSNKLTMVYEEKLVRLMVHRLQEKIKDLENGS